MNGVALRFYMHESYRHRGELLFKWLLRRANEQGIHGGSAFKAICGYGRHGIMHNSIFFEIADLPVVVEFIVEETEAAELLRLVEEDGAPLFWATFPAEFGVLQPPGLSADCIEPSTPPL